jgi:hypothetical protein
LGPLPFEARPSAELLRVTVRASHFQLPLGMNNSGRAEPRAGGVARDIDRPRGDRPFPATICICNGVPSLQIYFATPFHFAIGD